ncbi:MAG: hypothetical protein HOK71_21965 [Planctomycetaceae bacterium]|nr:hypothetical protein [Planctomycetaceae bacterium]MBT6487324.1 hypothetical protein [Planctomycetaceae bacterium]
MMSDIFVLIPGRTSRQGTALNEGKYTDTYKEEITTLLMNAEDMQRLDLETGDRVRMWNEQAEVVVTCKADKGESPPGVLFISYGDISSQLMGGDTHGSGMPTSKGLDVQLAKAE